MARALATTGLLACAVAGCAGVGAPVPGRPAHHREHGFANLNPGFERPGFWTVQAFRLRRVWAALFGGRPAPAFPRVANDGRALRENRGEATLTWVGHATLLIQLDGVNVLTDPHWSERASPLAWLGPRRLNPPGLAFEDLPPIHAVVISHDHYDHLDRATVQRLAATHRPRFLVPLGMKAWFTSVGIADGVEELDWWETRRVGAVTFTCVPIQHWSARTPWDTDRRLWSGWAVAGRARRAFFAGDTGYGEGFRELGARLGPFDLALVSISAYEPPAMMRHTHTTPEEALRLFADLGARTFVAMHWGTFDMSEEPVDEPPRRLSAEARRLGLPADRVWILEHGETRRW
ncbi:MAG: MBL fold metallo-hydrolase [Candidatus Rokubacteria bacterium]|nr:MBL fold metallo-hydrolase [Candidatus Rokubacteria bacterium]